MRILSCLFKPDILASLDLPDSPQTAPSVRSTRVRASKRDTALTGQFVCISIMWVWLGRGKCYPNFLLIRALDISMWQRGSDNRGCMDCMCKFA